MLSNVVLAAAVPGCLRVLRDQAGGGGGAGGGGPVGALPVGQPRHRGEDPAGLRGLLGGPGAGASQSGNTHRHNRPQYLSS